MRSVVTIAIRCHIRDHGDIEIGGYMRRDKKEGGRGGHGSLAVHMRACVRGIEYAEMLPP